MQIHAYSSTQHAPPLRELACHTASHSVTCPPAEATTRLYNK